MNIVVLGYKNHPYTLSLLAELEKHHISIKALVQRRRIDYTPEAVIDVLSRSPSTERGNLRRIFNKDNFSLAWHNPSFALRFLVYFISSKIRKQSPAESDVYIGSLEVVDIDLSSLTMETVDDYNGYESERLLKRLNPDIIIFGPAAQIIKKNILRIPRIGAISAHPSILPEYRGMDPVEYAILNGDKVGVTVYFVDGGVDTGDIILKKDLDISQDITLQCIRAKTVDLMVKLIADAVKVIEAGKYERIPQELNAGKQYYSIHPKLREIVQGCLKAYQK